MLEGDFPLAKEGVEMRQCGIASGADEDEVQSCECEAKSITASAKEG